MTQRLRLSLIIPVFNAESFLGTSIEEVTKELDCYFKDDYEVIIVDDGSTDATAEVLDTYLSKIPNHRIKRERFTYNRGKFAAIKYGAQSAQGEIIAFTDADVPFSLRTLSEMAETIQNGGVLLAIGDRNLDRSSIPKHNRIIRRIATTILSQIVGCFVTPGYFDTQCGLKAFRADCAAELFRLAKDDGFSGDVEIIYIALKHNLHPRKFPVTSIRNGPSTVRIFFDGLEMLHRIGRLRGDWKRGEYSSKTLFALSENSRN